jgi:hypothetical protein
LFKKKDEEKLKRAKVKVLPQYGLQRPDSHSVPELGLHTSHYAEGPLNSSCGMSNSETAQNKACQLVEDFAPVESSRAGFISCWSVININALASPFNSKVTIIITTTF